jgi:hypothetical protein
MQQLCAQSGKRSGLVLGFGATPAAEVERAVACLARAWRAWV